MTVGRLRKLLADPSLPSNAKFLASDSLDTILKVRPYWRVKTMKGICYFETKDSAKTAQEKARRDGINAKVETVVLMDFIEE